MSQTEVEVPAGTEGAAASAETSPQQAQGKDGGLDGVALAALAEGNAWDRAMQGGRDLLAGAHQKKETERAPDGEGTAADATAKDAAKDNGKAPAADATNGERTGAKEGDTDGDKPKDGTEPKKEDGEGDAKPKGAQYFLVDANGKAVDGKIAWPEGAKMKLTIGGQPVTVKSPEHLVTMAQQGALYHKEQARANRLTNDVQSLSERVERVNAASQDVLLAVLFGTEERTAEELADALREELAPFRDPRYRKGLEAERREADREKADESASTEAAEARTEAIWSEADEVFEDSLAEFPYLESGDAVAVKSVLHQQYVAAHKQAVVQLAPDAKAQKWTARQYADAAEELAGQVLTHEALKAAMKSLNDTYARRLKGKEPAAETPPSKLSTPAKAADTKGEDIKAEVAAHNANVDRKLEQADATRTLKGGGSAPSGTVSIPNLEGKSYEEQQAAWKKALRGAAR